MQLKSINQKSIYILRIYIKCLDEWGLCKSFGYFLLDLLFISIYHLNNFLSCKFLFPSLSLSLYIYIYEYIYVCVCVCVCVRERELSNKKMVIFVNKTK